MVEGAALEKQYAREGIVGSNPTLSARKGSADVAAEAKLCLHGFAEQRGRSANEVSAISLPFRQFGNERAGLVSYPVILTKGRRALIK